MLNDLNVEDLLFIDIETVPQHPEFSELKEDFQKLWDKKSTYFRTEDQGPDEVYERAGIYAEFGKIICILCQKNSIFYQKIFEKIWHRLSNNYFII